MEKQKLDVLVFRDHKAKAWVAQSMQKNVVAQGMTADLAFNRFILSLMGLCYLDLAADIKPLSRLAPSPQKSQAKYEQAIPAKFVAWIRDKDQINRQLKKLLAEKNYAIKINKIRIIPTRSQYDE